MGLINWIFDFYQQYRIDELRKETSEVKAQASVRASQGGVDVDRLEQAIGELVRVLQPKGRLR